jgi:hypothetical protein
MTWLTVTVCDTMMARLCYMLFIADGIKMKREFFSFRVILLASFN